jgi:hypothetical protein
MTKQMGISIFPSMDETNPLHNSPVGVPLVGTLDLRFY